MMRRRGSALVALVASVLLLSLVMVAADVALRGSDTARLSASRAMAGALDLTDLALFTEARYTRNLSQADLHTAFQDGPHSFEHFPSGSLAPPQRNFPAAGFIDGPDAP